MQSKLLNVITRKSSRITLFLTIVILIFFYLLGCLLVMTVNTERRLEINKNGKTTWEIKNFIVADSFLIKIPCSTKTQSLNNFANIAISLYPDNKHILQGEWFKLNDSFIYKENEFYFQQHNPFDSKVINLSRDTEKVTYGDSHFPRTVYLSIENKSKEKLSVFLQFSCRFIDSSKIIVKEIK